MLERARSAGLCSELPNKALKPPCSFPYLFDFLLGTGLGDYQIKFRVISEKTVSTDVYSGACSPANYNEANVFGQRELYYSATLLAQSYLLIYFVSMSF